MADQATYDPSTPIGRIRLMIADTDVSDAWFTDAELAAFLTIESGVEDLAAARALRAKAASFVDQMEQMGHYTDDQRGVVDSLLRQAKSLEDRVEHAPAEPAVAISSVAWNQFTRRDMVLKDRLERT